ncbi:uncharacterized protein GJ701_006973 [Geothlypis trichas]
MTKALELQMGLLVSPVIVANTFQQRGVNFTLVLREFLWSIMDDLKSDSMLLGMLEVPKQGYQHVSNWNTLGVAEGARAAFCQRKNQANCFWMSSRLGLCLRSEAAPDTAKYIGIAKKSCAADPWLAAMCCCAWNEPLFGRWLAEPRDPARKEQQPVIIRLSVAAPARCECRTHQDLHLSYHVGHVVLQQVCHTGVKAKDGEDPVCLEACPCRAKMCVYDSVCAPSMAGAEERF